MALADPQVITVNAIARNLPATTRGANLGVYNTADGNTKLTVSHAYGKRSRSLVRFDTQKISADPFLPTTNVVVGMSASLVIDRPKAGFTIAEQLLELKGYIASLTDAQLTKILGGES